MSRTISSASRKKITAPQSSEAFLTLLVIESDELTTPLYFVQNNVNITSSVHDETEQEFIAANFDMKLPSQEESATQEATITISAINRQVIEAIRSISDPPIVHTYIVASSTLDVVELGPFEFKLRNISYDVNSVSGSLLYEYTLRNNISAMTITSQNFPGLF